jgi:acyl transferase domain-containing protein
VGTLRKQEGSTGKVMASLAELHARGVPVDWEPVFAADRPRRMSLPTYPFQRRPYWLTAPDEGTGSDPRSSGHASRPAAAPTQLTSESAVLSLVCAEAAMLLSTDTPGLAGADLAAQAAVTFKALGFDSAMAVRFRNRLNAAAGVQLPATVAFTYPSPQTLARHIFSLLEPEQPAAPQAEDSTSGEVRSDDELYELINRGYV